MGKFDAALPHNPRAKPTVCDATRCTRLTLERSTRLTLAWIDRHHLCTRGEPPSVLIAEDSTHR